MPVAAIGSIAPAWTCSMLRENSIGRGPRRQASAGGSRWVTSPTRPPSPAFAQAVWPDPGVATVMQNRARDMAGWIDINVSSDLQSYRPPGKGRLAFVRRNSRGRCSCGAAAAKMTAMARRHGKLVIFDCDGVLVDSEILACGVQSRALCGLWAAYRPRGGGRSFPRRLRPDMRAALEIDLGGPLPSDHEARCGQELFALFRS